MNASVHLTVAAVIEQAGRFLLVEETATGRIVLNQPAGHWEIGETLQEAVIREVREESGLHFTPQAVLGLYQYTSPHNGVTYLRVCFTGSHTEDADARPLDPAILRTLWLSPEALRAAHDRLRSPMVLRCVADYLAGERYPLSVLKELVICPDFH